jgi:hypothetical protein
MLECDTGFSVMYEFILIHNMSLWNQNYVQNWYYWFNSLKSVYIFSTAGLLKITE